MYRQASLFGQSPGLVLRPDLSRRLKLLTEGSRFDLAGSCAKDPLGRGRRRGPLGRWLYPVTLPNGRRMTLLRTLLSSVCFNDCAYCPLRVDTDPPRASLTPEELVRVFMGLYRRGLVQGLFLSTGVFASPDVTMERLIACAQILREKEGFTGYIHLKVIPGASREAIATAARYASALSLNIEVPGETYLSRLSRKKDFRRHLLEGLAEIARLKERLGRPLSQTTQFIVGASGEDDAAIIRTTELLYRKFRLNRVYFSAYQPGFGRGDLPGEKEARRGDLRTREHRLYQVDFLLRKYGFRAAEIPLEKGRLPLDTDPKELWARAHPEFFPVDLHKASYWELLRVPGIGPTVAKRILAARRETRIRNLENFFPNQKLLAKALPYVVF